MTRLADQRSIVAIDPNSRGLAFAFFESGILLDWGIRRNDRNQLSSLDRLVTAFKADVVVIEDPDAPRCERRSRVRRLLRTMDDHVQKQGISVVRVSRHEVRRIAAERGMTTKHRVALEIGREFPEIEYLVPPPRKRFDSEEWRTDIFDAISLVLHAFQQLPSAA
jgi:hypothetical protein